MLLLLTKDTLKGIVCLGSIYEDAGLNSDKFLGLLVTSYGIWSFRNYENSKYEIFASPSVSILLMIAYASLSDR